MNALSSNSPKIRRCVNAECFVHRGETCPIGKRDTADCLHMVDGEARTNDMFEDFMQLAKAR